MKKILITGAGGFIGSHLTEFLVKKGYTVKAFLRYNSQNNWGWLERSKILNEIEIILGDIRDYDSVNKALKGCDTVFHLAALISIPYSYISPLAYIKTNIEGTYNILDNALKNNLENIIITSTSETYGSAKYIPIDENHPKLGQSPYSASKIAADQLALSYYLSFNLPVKIIRPFNTYGPRQSLRAIIPTIIIQLLRGCKKIKSGSLYPSRDFVFVNDTINAFYKIALSKKTIGEEINVATGNELSMNDLAKKIIEFTNVRAGLFFDKKRTRPNKSEVNRLVGSYKKINELTGWKSKYSIDEGLNITIKWFKSIQKSINYRFKIYNV
jgi:dTDP-glucose 4,6-dehydratase